MVQRVSGSALDYDYSNEGTICISLNETNTVVNPNRVFDAPIDSDTIWTHDQAG